MTPERCSMSCLNPFGRTHLTLPHTRIAEIEADVRMRNEDKTQVKKKKKKGILLQYKDNYGKILDGNLTFILYLCLYIHCVEA